MISKNIEFLPALKISPWRKIAIGTWRRAADPQVYGWTDLEVQPALDYINKISKESGQRITITHFMGRAMAEVFRRHPSINCVLRFGKIYPRKDIDIFFQVASDSSGEDLSGTLVRRADRKSMIEIAREMTEGVREIRNGDDKTYKKSKGMIGLLPGIAVGPLLDFLSFINYKLNIWSPLLGTPRDSFGSLMITNIGSLGLDQAFGPLVPYSCCPALMVMGAIVEKAVVRNHQVVIETVLPLTITLDHRVIDGMHGSQMVKTLKAIFRDPNHELDSNSDQRV
jgi:pyruvate/2-oxoglutarate dehydrogenase complex dihydrolipoamide acyltransferase (E2) component